MKIESINIADENHIFNVKMPRSKVDVGLKVIVSADVPKDELWFVDEDGALHKITNIGTTTRTKY